MWVFTAAIKSTLMICSNQPGCTLRASPSEAEEGLREGTLFARFLWAMRGMLGWTGGESKKNCYRSMERDVWSRTTFPGLLEAQRNLETVAISIAQQSMRQH